MDILKSRFLVTKRGCVGCLEYYRFLPLLNMRLPLGKKIRILDNFEYEEFFMDKLLILNRFKAEDLKNYPILYLDGMLFSGAEWAEQLKRRIMKFCEKDLLI